MIAIAFALSSSLLYGTADFLGGFATKRLSVFVVAPISKLFAAIIITCVSFAYSPFSIASGDWPWLILAAFSTVSAICCLYHALANGKMSVVAPLTGGCAIMLPALVSVLLGEVPSFWQIVGLLCAYLSIYLVSRPERMAPLAGATAIPRPSHLKELLAGRTIERPTYDFTVHNRAPETVVALALSGRLKSEYRAEVIQAEFGQKLVL